MKINYKKLFGYILITFLIGSIFSIFTMDSEYYKELIKPIDIPAITFPIVWSILYLLMSISVYMISESNNLKRREALTYYFMQLIFNSLWTLLFFGFKLISFSFIWCVILLILVIIMSIKFYRINKISAYLNLPYIAWLLFASYLNLSILILN